MIKEIVLSETAQRVTEARKTDFEINPQPSDILCIDWVSVRKMSLGRLITDGLLCNPQVRSAQNDS